MKSHKNLYRKMYIIRNNDDTYKCLYLNRDTLIPFFLKKNSCDIRILTFIAWNLMKLYMQHSINVVDLYRRKFCDGHNILVFNIKCIKYLL